MMKSNNRQDKSSGISAMLIATLAAAVMFAGAAVPVPAQTPTTLYGFQNAFN